MLIKIIRKKIDLSERVKFKLEKNSEIKEKNQNAVNLETYNEWYKEHEEECKDYLDHVWSVFTKVNNNYTLCINKKKFEEQKEKKRKQKEEYDKLKSCEKSSIWTQIANSMVTFVGSFPLCKEQGDGFFDKDTEKYYKMNQLK